MKNKLEKLIAKYEERCEIIIKDVKLLLKIVEQLWQKMVLYLIMIVMLMIK